MHNSKIMKITSFARFAWFTLLVNILVIIGGAYVRATGSGAGCGAHWPLCNGSMLPDTSRIHTIIEFSHRITSGIALICVLVMLVWAWRKIPRWQPVHTGVVLSAFFILMEAALGAGLVLFEYVAFNVSIARAYWMAAHLVNTFLLLSFLTLTVWWASGGARLSLRGDRWIRLTLGLAFLGTLILGSSGAITALGDTLTLAGGISPTESVIVAQLIGLRLLHPMIAFAVGALLWLAAWTVSKRRPTKRNKQFATLLMAIYAVQLLAGALNVAWLAPVWLQLIHLLLADSLWITLVFLAASALEVEQSKVDTRKSSVPLTTKDGFMSQAKM